VIKVVFVPLRHDGRVPDTTEATIAAYVKGVEKLYPTVKVEASVTATLSSNQSGISVDLGSILDQVTDKREQDAPADNVYYYGLIDPASSMGKYCGYGCTTGVGWVPDVDGWWASGHQVAVGIGFGESGVGTFAHELGHNHGRNHSPCGGAAGADPSYPHSGAGIGTWGYDREKQRLVDPSQHTDFMGYCDPTWVSDYSFQALLERIARLNGVQGYEVKARSSEPLQTWRRMLVTQSGAVWSTSKEGRGPPGGRAELGVIFDANGNQIAQVSVYRMEMSDGGGYMLYVPSAAAGYHSIGLPGGPRLAY